MGFENAPRRPNIESSRREELQESQEGFSPELKAGAAVTTALLWGAYEYFIGRYDRGEQKQSAWKNFWNPQPENHPDIEDRGWLGAMAKKGAEIYQGMDDIENILNGNYGEVLKRRTDKQE